MKITDKYVFFWKEHPMCNFTRCKITVDNQTFTSSEQLFMWYKATYFEDFVTAEQILQSHSPEEARRLGRQVKNYDDQKWDKVRVTYMKMAVTLKFQQNPDLLQQLLDTRFKGKTFVEAAYYDRIWGIGFNENDAMQTHETRWGHNELGKILTEIRDNYEE